MIINCISLISHLSFSVIRSINIFCGCFIFLMRGTSRGVFPILVPFVVVSQHCKQVGPVYDELIVYTQQSTYLYTLYLFTIRDPPALNYLYYCMEIFFEKRNVTLCYRRLTIQVSPQTALVDTAI